jgi:hypothetical protein
MKNVVFWDVMPCGSCKNRRFGEMYLPHHVEKNSDDGRDNIYLRNVSYYKSHTA